MGTLILEIKESFMIAFNAIRANKVRAALTMLGIIIGVTVVVLMSIAIKGIDNNFEKGISALGSDVLYIDKWAWFTNNEWWKMRKRRNIDMDDFERFKEFAKLPLAVAPVMNARETIKYNDKRIESLI